MTVEQLRAAAIALFGERGWMSRLAEALGVDRSTVSRWFGGLPVPGPAAAAVTAMLELQYLKIQLAALATGGAAAGLARASGEHDET